MTTLTEWGRRGGPIPGAAEDAARARQARLAESVGIPGGVLTYAGFPVRVSDRHVAHVWSADGWLPIAEFEHRGLGLEDLAEARETVRRAGPEQSELVEKFERGPV